MHEKMFPHNWSSLDAFKPLFKTFSSSLTCSDTFISNVFQFVAWSKIFVFFLGYPDISPWTTAPQAITHYEIPPRTLNHGLLPCGQLSLNNWPLDKYPPTNCSMKFSSAPLEICLMDNYPWKVSPGTITTGQRHPLKFPTWQLPPGFCSLTFLPC